MTSPAACLSRKAHFHQHSLPTPSTLIAPDQTFPPTSTSLKVHLASNHLSPFFTLTLTLPRCLHASWLCSCLSPWDLLPSHWSKPPPFSLLIGRGARGRGHGGAEALHGWWASTTWMGKAEEANTDRQTLTITQRHTDTRQTKQT